MNVFYAIIIDMDSDKEIEKESLLPSSPNNAVTEIYSDLATRERNLSEITNEAASSHAESEHS